MDIYDSRYFSINKRSLQLLGLWPFDSRIKNITLRTIILISTLIMFLPQFISVYKHFGKDFDIIMANLYQVLYFFIILIKIVTTITGEKQITIVYENIANNFQIIVNKKERDILFDYAERGRVITISFISYMLLTVNVYNAAPIIPVTLDYFFPRNESRSRIFICSGDFLVDRYEYYMMIYLFDVVSCWLTIMVVFTVDPIYAAVVEHCLALFAIVKYRLQLCTKIDKEIGSYAMNDDQATYKFITETIKLHKETIKFTKLLEESYTTYFLFIMGSTILAISTVAVIIISSLDQAFQCARFTLVLGGLTIHMFFLTWPSQKIINHSSNLSLDTYLNDWYQLSSKNKNLLKFMALRCSVPCQLTAGGVYMMNFINFASVMKTAASFITVFSSFK